MLIMLITCIILKTIMGDDEDFVFNYWWRFVWAYALLLSHMFMYSWLMVEDFKSILVTTNTLYSIIGKDYDVMFASWGDDFGDDW